MPVLPDTILQLRLVHSNDINIAVRRQECSEWPHALVFSGRGHTDASGHWTIDLGKVNCLRPGPGGDQQVAFVATPTRPRVKILPVHRPTVLEVVEDTPTQFTVESYFLDGKPAPDVPFSWIAMLPGTLVRA
jgi:hypothetical protein